MDKSHPAPAKGGSASGGKAGDQQDSRLRGMDSRLHFFVDFDGTISTTDVVDTLLERFAKSQWRDVEKDWADGKIGSRECLSRQIDFVIATEADLAGIVDSIQIDPHFVLFLKTARSAGVPVTIVSDGFDLFIEPLLKKALQSSPELLTNLPVFCNSLFWTGKGLKAVFSRHICEHGCANCKPAAIKKHAAPSERIVFIGDGLSDRYAAGIADLTFAKGKLLDYCVKNGLRHRAFTDFSEIEKWLAANVKNADPILT